MGRRLTIHPALITKSLVVRIGHKVIRWVFEHDHGRWLSEHHILPWALPEAELLSPDIAADVCVGVHLHNAQLIREFYDSGGVRFMLASEPEHRYPTDDQCWSFVQDERATDGRQTRYSPILAFWCPPLSSPKSRKCSVVDSGRYKWRADKINRASQVINAVDVFGSLAKNPLAGYHCLGGSLGNDKYLGLKDHAFYLSIERATVTDYVTEKFCDAIICESVPIYQGAPNINLYAVEGSFIPFAALDQVCWSDWEREYESRSSRIKAQKELLRTTFNVFSYFDKITDHMELLEHKRPITI
jgi:hypothetical protein